MAGPTSFAPIIEMAITTVEQSSGQYHVLVIIADGQVIHLKFRFFFFFGWSKMKFSFLCSSDLRLSDYYILISVFPNKNVCLALLKLNKFILV